MSRARDIDVAARSTPPSLLNAAPPTPHLLNGDGDPWKYYVPGHDTEALLDVDEPDALEWESVWMRPMPVSSVDPEERGDWEAVERDDKGRFRSAFCWIECGEQHSDARPFLGVRYKPC